MEGFWRPLSLLIAQICTDFDGHWQQRKRVITTQFLVLFILKLVLSKNSQGYKSLLTELWETEEFCGWQQHPISSSSLCEARQKMPETIFLEINRHLLAEREKTVGVELWHGHRVFGVDGSKINLPRELISAGYKTSHKNQHYPQGLMSTLYHLGSGLIYDGILSSKSGERMLLLDHMEQLSPGDVVVVDRGYFSYLVLVKAMEKGLHLLCRMQSGDVNKSVQSFLDSDDEDAIITYEPSIAVKYESRKRGYDIELNPIKLRLIKYTIEDEIYICATTLMGKEYSLRELSDVYHGRWGIEELYKISKTFIDVEDFHGRSERGVKQECYAHMLLINVARIFESEANKQQPPPSESLSTNNDQERSKEQRDSYWQDFCGGIKKMKINFKHCLRVIDRYLTQLFFPIDHYECAYINKLLTSISRVRQKIRRGRHVPRLSRKTDNKWESSARRKIH